MLREPANAKAACSPSSEHLKDMLELLSSMLEVHVLAEVRSSSQQIWAVGQPVPDICYTGLQHQVGTNRVDSFPTYSNHLRVKHLTARLMGHRLTQNYTNTGTPWQY